VNISNDLFKYYLRGLVDADGHFSSGRRKDRNRVWVNFGITHQSLSLLQSVQRYLHEKLDISTFINPRNDENCMDLKISKKESIKKLINWITEDELSPFDKKYQTDKALMLLAV
jgi:hypothetical protein